MAKDKKTDGEPKCKINRTQFTKAAPKFLTLTVTDDKGNQLGVLQAAARDFSSGGFGFGASEKMSLTIDGELCKLQCGINLSIIGSKDLAK